MENTVYQELAKHLDRLPGGLPPTVTGLERINLGEDSTPEPYPSSRRRTFLEDDEIGTDEP